MFRYMLTPDRFFVRPAQLSFLSTISRGHLLQAIAVSADIADLLAAIVALMSRQQLLR